MAWLLMILGSIVAVEIILRLPLKRQFHAMTDISRRSARVLRSPNISDHWKERMLPSYALRLARASTSLFLIFCAAIAPLLLVGLFMPGGVIAWVEQLARPLSIIVLTIASLLYVMARGRAVGV
jgi:hypothetical protein